MEGIKKVKWLKWLWIFNIVIWLITVYLWGWNNGFSNNSKQYKKYLNNKIIFDIPQGSIMITRKEGNFLISKIANKETFEGLGKYFKENLPIQLYLLEQTTIGESE